MTEPITGCSFLPETGSTSFLQASSSLNSGTQNGGVCPYFKPTAISKARDFCTRCLAHFFPNLAIPCQNAASPFMVMDDVLEKLKLLDYEQNFCRVLNFRPLTRIHFAVAAKNKSEQFYQFACLIAWLSELLGHRLEHAPQLADDPNASTTNILSQLRALGFNTDFPPAQITQGWGDAVCAVLNGLCDLENLLIEEGDGEGSVDSDEDGATAVRPTPPPAGMADAPGVAALPGAAKSLGSGSGPVMVSRLSDLPPSLLPPQAGSPVRGAPAPASTIPDRPVVVVRDASCDATGWRVEAERVGPQLRTRISTVLSIQSKDWRSRIEAMHADHQALKAAMGPVVADLGSMGRETAADLSKIEHRERYFNAQCDHLTSQHRAVAVDQKAAAAECRKGSEAVAELSAQLAREAEALEALKGQMDEYGNTLSDTGPLMKLRHAYKALKLKPDAARLPSVLLIHPPPTCSPAASSPRPCPRVCLAGQGEIRQMNLRIGVLQHGLLRARVADTAGDEEQVEKARGPGEEDEEEGSSGEEGDDQPDGSLPEEDDGREPPSGRGRPFDQPLGASRGGRR
ncbi:putative Intraflagellar transport protein 57 [Paratrimastix pyriformis]|uniref:Intraflagellar transport protein 57 n=1 Tax=Paratrimastix pyriformis TaxID=342808 RepID=A0ABQ8UKD1_9EUKA|nr:putative Intraflagellar transport protein 57 [Paratrimastix pyriformis]